MEPSPMGEFEDFDDEMDDLEGEAAASRRQFTLLALGLGGVLVVGVIAFVVVMLSRNGAKSSIELTNEVVEATNQAIQDAIVATETAEVVQRTVEAVAMAATGEAEQQAAADSATSAAATAAAQPTPTGTPTPTIPFATSTEEGGDGTSIAQITGTLAPTATRTPFGAATTPDTGIGGLGAVLIAAVLVVVMFAARRLRMAA